MKQHITEEQLKELTDLQRQALLNYTEEKGWYPQFTRPTLMLHTFNKYLSDCIGIGQMIEFISDHEVNPHFPHQEWFDYVIKETQECGDVLIPYTSDELCDALWEAVKEVLGE